MKLVFTPILLLCLFFVPAYFVAQLSEDFSDGDFTNNPTWSGDNAKYQISVGNQLQSNGLGNSETTYLSTNIGNLDFSQTTTWSFFMQMDFNPSTTNQARVYLVSDNANLTGSLNGYYVKIGASGSADAIEFYKQVGNSSTLLHSGTGNTFATNPTASIRVTRSPSGDWTFESDATGGTNYIAEGTINNTDITNTQFFGVFSKYSSTRGDKFFYDNFNISGTIIVDNTPPIVTSVSVISNNQLDVNFNEPIDIITAQNTSNYSVNNSIGNPTSALLDGTNPSLVHLTFGNTFADGQTNTITIQNIQDISSNTMVSSSHNFLYFIPVNASFKDIVINEIFADPSPQYGLPSGEYIELYNASTHIFDLTNWTIGDASSDEQIGGVVLQPGEYLIIADDAFTYEFSIYNNVQFVSNLPSYNNSADDVILKDGNGSVIDKVSYTTAWYNDATKAMGGYSLELINPTIPCTSSSNWTASNSTDGGTPGMQNSVYDGTPDNVTPNITSASTANNATINLCFSETIDTIGVSLANFSINNGINISSFSFNNTLECVEIITSNSLDTGVVYTISVNGLSDCSGNTMNSSKDVILPHLGQKGDLVINEILYNPFPDGADFVELYNNSNKNIDLYNWTLAKEAGDTISSPKLIDTHYLLQPNSYVVITKDSNDIKLRYATATEGRFIQLASLPSYSDNEGTVILLLPNNQVADSVHYDDSFQYALLKETEGVSLERIDFNRPSNDPTNWHSASEAIGFASPTVQNSQYQETEQSNATITVLPELFSPDNDGYEDVTTISYTMSKAGFVGNITIYDANGRVIRQLMQNQLLGIKGSISWDGLNNNKEKARIGAYIIYFEYFDLEGNVNATKLPCVVGGRFN